MRNVSKTLSDNGNVFGQCKLPTYERGLSSRLLVLRIFWVKVEKSVWYCFGGVSEGVLESQKGLKMSQKWLLFTKKVLVTRAEHVLRSKYCRERNQVGLVTLQQTWFVLKLRKTCKNHENGPGGIMRKRLGCVWNIVYGPLTYFGVIFQSCSSCPQMSSVAPTSVWRIQICFKNIRQASRRHR